MVLILRKFVIVNDKVHVAQISPYVVLKKNAVVNNCMALYSSSVDTWFLCDNLNISWLIIIQF